MWREETIRWVIGSVLARCRPYGLFHVLQQALEGCETVLDVGCGSYSIMRYLTPGRSFTGLDKYSPSLRNNRNYYDRLLQADIMQCPIEDKSFDAVVAMDVIEHLSREDGLKMLETIETIARKSVVIHTPNGYLHQPPAPDNPWQEHRSGWAVSDFRSCGYEVFGISGSKRLRGEYARIKRRPLFFWELISACSAPYCRRHPESAFSLCAVKSLRRRKETRV